MQEQCSEEKWRRFGRCLITTLLAGASVIAGILLMLDPYGISPVSWSKPRPLMDINARYMYPQVIRHGDHDSLVVGTSISRLMHPRDLNETFGGRFANLAMNGATAWEQINVIRAFQNIRGAPQTLIVGLDHTWCAADADEATVTERDWPAWLWEGSGPSRLVHTINLPTLEIAVRQIGQVIGIEQPRFDSDGWGAYTPDESLWDEAEIHQTLWGGSEPVIKPVDPPYQPEPQEREQWRFPALPWLDETLAELPRDSRLALVFMPVHITAQPRPGSAAAAREAACKADVAAIADRHGAAYVDFRVHSPVTRDDTMWWNRYYWRQHYGPHLIRKMADRTASAWRETASVE